MTVDWIRTFSHTLSLLCLQQFLPLSFMDQMAIVVLPRIPAIPSLLLGQTFQLGYCSELRLQVPSISGS